MSMSMIMDSMIDWERGKGREGEREIPMCTFAGLLTLLARYIPIVCVYARGWCFYSCMRYV